MSTYLRNHAWILISTLGKTFMVIPTAQQLENGVVLESPPGNDSLMQGRLVGGDLLTLPTSDIKTLYRMGV